MISKNGHKNTIVSYNTPCSTLALRQCSTVLETDNGTHIFYTSVLYIYKFSQQNQSEYERTIAAGILTIYEYLVCTSTTTTVHNLTSLTY